MTRLAVYAALLRFAQRAFIATEMRLRAAADIVLRLRVEAPSTMPPAGSFWTPRISPVGLERLIGRPAHFRLFTTNTV